MSKSNPNLMTLLGWADRLAAGERLADWEAWCGSSPAAAERWERIEAAEELLDDGDVAVDQESEISAEEIAAFLDGGLPVNEARRTEESCWQSTEALAEALSAVRFGAANSTCHAYRWIGRTATQASAAAAEWNCIRGDPR